MRVAQFLIIGVSVWIILGGDWIWETLWPQKFWNQRVSELENTAKLRLWNLKSVEWEVMKGRVALSIGVSAAEDKAKCLGVDCEEPVKKIKEEARERLKTLIQEEAKTRRAYEASLQQLKEAREKLVSLQERSQGAGEMQ